MSSSSDIRSTLALIRSGVLDADDIMFQLAHEDLMFICNGCGAKGKFDFVPDTIWFLSITEACNIHDVDYKFGKDDEAKRRADRRMRNNILRLIVLRSFWLFIKIRRLRAQFYYKMVDNFGGPAFWVNKNTDKRNL